MTNAVSTEETHFTGHKFRALDRNFWKNLKASTVHFSSPHKLNDPYDCQIDLMKAIRLAKFADEPPTDALLERWQSFATAVTAPAATCGIFSLCAGDIRGMDESLLWAHYADNHRGVCVTYEIPYKFVNNCKRSTSATEQLLAMILGCSLLGKRFRPTTAHL